MSKHIFEMVATTAFGFEDLLAGELEKIGADRVTILNRAVQFFGDQEMLYKANLMLRTAMKILKPIATFVVKNEDDLYTKLQEIQWTHFFTVNETFAIDAVTNSETFTHSKFASLKSKDAIVDQFRDSFGIRPSVDIKEPDVRINVHITGEKCTVSLDSSGQALSKRAYKVDITRAPLNELLAAGLILLSGWEGKTDFYDPMCGSGTLAIEAALIANNIAPGKFRRFGFEFWMDFDSILWESIREEAIAAEVKSEIKIVASDINPKALDIAKANAEEAGLLTKIEFFKGDFFRVDAPVKDAHLLMNPPYGERLEMSNLEEFYGEIGTRLKHAYDGSEAWILSSDMMALKKVGLRPSRKIKVFNGSLECRLNKFELYRGTKRTHKLEDQNQ